MKPFTLLLFLLAAVALHAQVGLDINLNRNVYMQYEPVYAAVTIRNDSGKALVFGSDPQLQGSIQFEIKDLDGKVIPARPDAALTVSGLVLRPGELRRLVLPISKYYDIDRLGSYRVNAYVSHAMLPVEYKSRDLKFTVDRGFDVWKRTVGLPDMTNGKPTSRNEQRTYSVRSLIDINNRYFYLVVEDDKTVYGVARLGEAVGQERVMAEVDMLSRIHLLVPVTPKVKHYIAFALDGANIANEFRKMSDTIPTIYKDPENGVVTFLGGSPAIEGVDYVSPRQGVVTATQLMNERGEPISPIQTPPPTAPANSGLVDLGPQ